MKAVLGAVALCCSLTAAEAACPDVSLMQNAARGWIAGQRLPDPLVRNMDDARCAYTSFRAVLEAELGAPVGVKVAFTSRDVQKRFDIEEPVAGLLFSSMLLADGARVSLKGSRSPLYEADLVVVVRDSSIMRARTREEAAAALSEIRPFIEFPDIALSRGSVPTGPLMAAYGVTPWRGVMGKGIALADLEDPVEALEEMNVSLRLNGDTIAVARGELLLGHPLDVVLWLVEQGGYELKPGSIISLGSFASFDAPAPGQRIEVEYNLAGQTMQARATIIP
ncbi:MAG TPA: fumarylacetoacetate hydrolase family protein [Paracoccus sp. (in: a-proteobacteria)]|uniref:fumarylacetoacetate hydrolase family protein n=1 Tax=Paracoccus sp. TaxID=267 RepID=UPI002B9F7843|nr:fumarylacetoacetate hydrolase family protein [Paracoccus sp. (in: a-proteobacteria)]HWL55361.1 fumarylacetoacetate hydrolase family protein [Paracoccus sp. (in: a-proteobacteria)]